MVFSNLTFLFLYLPLFLAVYFIAPKRVRNALLFAGGFVFYFWGEPVFIWALILSTMIDYTFGILMYKYDDKPKVRKAALIGSIVMNLSLLAFFKYGMFIAENINAIAGSTVVDVNNTSLPIGILPVGISFYTFQTLSYTIDLYRRNITVQKNLIDFGAFVTMFPQIVAGPIVRYEEVAKELKKRVITVDMIYVGICRFVIGLGKKVLIANNIGLLWDAVKASEVTSLSTATAWLGALAFTFQIYFDFSGYSDMAIGLGKILGFNFPENFNYPYLSHSISEFWRRWHITLGNWFKSYVYFPLGGSRVTKSRTILNLAVVWLLTGIWHGANWTFILWGSVMGVFVIIERLFLGKILEKIPWLLSNIYVMFVVMLLWVLFALPSVGDAAAYIKVMFGGGNGLFLDQQAAYMLMNYGIMLAVCVFGCSDFPKNTVAVIERKFPVLVNYVSVVVTAGIFVCSVAYLVNEGYNPFLYTNF